MKFAPYITIYDFDESGDIQNEVIWTFSSFLKGVSSIRQRFNIHVVRNLSKERQSLYGSIKSIWKYVSVDKYITATKKEQKILLLNLITKCFLDVSEVLGWDDNLILEAKEKSLNQNIDFQYSSKPVKNISGETSARIELQLTEKKVSIWVLFAHKNSKELIKKHFIDTSVEQISLFRNFDKPVWINATHFGFRFRNEMTLSISLNDNNGIWSDTKSKMDELFKKQIDFNEKLPPEEYVKLTNW